MAFAGALEKVSTTECPNCKSKDIEINELNFEVFRLTKDNYLLEERLRELNIHKEPREFKPIRRKFIPWAQKRLELERRHTSPPHTKQPTTSDTTDTESAQE